MNDEYAGSTAVPNTPTYPVECKTEEDLELQVMQQIVDAVSVLSDTERCRVLRWAWGRFVVQAKEALRA